MSENYREALVRKKAEILTTGGVRPLAATMENNSRQGDMADQADGNNEVHIQLKLKQTCGEPISPARLHAIPWTRVCITCKEKQNQ
jgi:RNA polymerase-binding transcription factor DksA